MLQQKLSHLTLNMFVFGRPSKTQLLMTDSTECRNRRRFLDCILSAFGNSLGNAPQTTDRSWNGRNRTANYRPNL